MLPDLRITQQFVDHVGPPTRARRRAMDEHHGESARAIRVESGKPRGRLFEEIAYQEPAQLTRPDVPITQAIGERGSTLDLERNILSAKAYASGLRRGADLQRGIQSPGCKLPPRIADAQHRRDRDFHSRGD